MTVNGYLPKDWDWAASALSVGFPSLPYLVSSSSGGRCYLITRGAPPIPRTVPNFEDALKVNPNTNSLKRVAAGLLNSSDQTQVSGNIRAPPVAPKKTPAISTPSDQETVQRTEAPSDYQSDRYTDRSTSEWKWSDYRYRS